ncbi:PD40 domain-containing protein [Salidesulfovibrio brasiliensis]|uniref:PD40 domain-containing protein n=1 Tax=Salidesulfovibrio brasiliensis TaxID=221711 RepID=UPI0006D00802|nr:PD40 domain-containing protein [Salidesulfovibrio brasiliensis]
MKRYAVIALALVMMLSTFSLASAQDQAPLTVDIFGPGQRQVNLVILPPRSLEEQMPQFAETFEKTVKNNLSYLPFIKGTQMSQLLGGDPSKGVRSTEIDFRPLQLAKIDLVMTTGWKPNGVEVRVFDTFGRRMIIGKAYGRVSKENVVSIADRFCSAFVDALTGKKAFFDSPLAFVRQLGKSKEIYTVLPQGRELTRITTMGGFNLGPAWSPDGSKLAFTHIGGKSHYLGIFDAKTGKTTLHTEKLGQSVISPEFMPGGGLAVTLNRHGHADIFQLDGNYKPRRVLAKSSFIDVSPSFDRAGRKMVFTSGRAGNPHIYMMDLQSGSVRRITLDGPYNTHPCISPDGRYIAYNRRTGSGHRIFVYDLATGRDRQVSFGPGSDEYPAFGPDGYFIAFASNRSGQYKLYLTTRHGDAAKMIQTGSGAAFAPAWDTKLQ